ncbi:MAG: hypothetical protein ABEK17_02940 [Candidatus Aenigmatarchaeota archaeon]
MDFARVLVVGLIIFGVLYVFFGGEPAFFDIGRDTGQERNFEFKMATREDENRTIEEGYFFIGKRKEHGTKRVNLNGGNYFGISSRESERNLLKIGEFKVSRGLVSKSNKKRKFYLSSEQLKNIQNAGLRAKISSTNQYGVLVIKLNGELIHEGLESEGELIEIPLDKSLLERENIIEISTTSSGWRLWAPSVYFISDFEIKSDILVKGTQSFTVSVPDWTYRNYNSARLVLSHVERMGEGRINVNFNGKNILNEKVSDYKIIDLNPEQINLKKEDNFIHFRTTDETEYRLKSSLLLNWNEVKTGNVGIDIDITEEDIESLPGKIKFLVGDVYSDPGKLSLEVINPDSEKHVLFDKGVSEGRMVRVDIQKEHLGIGKNEFIFSVGKNGGCKISDLEIGI